jgi:hypothetical protein
VLLREGGVQLHVMPVFGDVNHGFYNIHPTVYFDLAKANDYLVEDIRYLDQINRRTDEHVERFRDDMDFDALPIGRAQLESHMTIGAEIDKNLLAVQKRTSGAAGRDYAFVAMRKVRDQPFRIPIQRLYAT